MKITTTNYADFKIVASAYSKHSFFNVFFYDGGAAGFQMTAVTVGGFAVTVVEGSQPASFAADFPLAIALSNGMLGIS